MSYAIKLQGDRIQPYEVGSTSYSSYTKDKIKIDRNGDDISVWEVSENRKTLIFRADYSDITLDGVSPVPSTAEEWFDSIHENFLITNFDTINSTESTLNSSTTPLLANTDFTGTAEDIVNYAAITVFVCSDTDSDPNGLKIEFSSDGINWDDNYVFTILADIPRRFQFPVGTKYFRVIFQNGGDEQTEFRLQTILHETTPGYTSIHIAEQVVAPDRSAELVKAILVARVNGSGDFIPVQATATGVLKTSGGGGGGGASSNVTIVAYPVYTGSITTLTSPGTSVAVDVAGSQNGVVAVTIGTIDTNVVVSIQGSIDGVNWFEIASDQTFTSNGSYYFTWNSIPLTDVRVNFESESGGTNATVDASVRAM